MAASLSSGFPLAVPGARKEHGIPGQPEPGNHRRGGRSKKARGLKVGHIAQPKAKIRVPGMNKYGLDVGNKGAAIHAAQEDLNPDASFRRKYGIPPKGPGPHADSDYGFPLPPAGHPGALKYARAVVARAHQAGNFDPAKVVAQVRKAQAIIKKSNPDYKAKEAAPFDCGGYVLLREAGVTGGIRVVLIRSGPGNPADRHFYGPDLLQDAVNRKLFEGAQCYLDHPTEIEDKIQPERTVTKLAGYYRDVSMGSDEKGTPVIEATFVPQQGDSKVANMLRTAAEYARQFPDKSYVGFSINASGSTDTENTVDVDGTPYFPVKRFDDVTSVDLVTRAGAGGKLISLQESFKLATTANSGKLSKDNGTMPRAKKAAAKSAEAATKTKEAASDRAKAVGKAVKAHDEYKQKLSDAGIKLPKELEAALDGLLGISPGSILNATNLGGGDKEDDDSAASDAGGSADSGGPDAGDQEDDGTADGPAGDTGVLEDVMDGEGDEDQEDDQEDDAPDAPDNAQEDDAEEDDAEEVDVAEDDTDAGSDDSEEADDADVQEDDGDGDSDDSTEDDADVEEDDAEEDDEEADADVEDDADEAMLGPKIKAPAAGKKLVDTSGKTAKGGALVDTSGKTAKGSGSPLKKGQPSRPKEDDADIESMSGPQAKEALKAARAKLKEAEKQVSTAKAELHKALRENAQIKALDKYQVPTNHRPRLMREMGRLYKGENFEDHIRDYIAAHVGQDGAGAVARESAAPSKTFEVDCFEDDLD